MEASYREVIKGLIQIVWADGTVDDRERVILGEMLTELGLNQKDLTEVGKMMQEAPNAKEFEEIMKDYHELVDHGRREIYNLEG